MREPRICWMCRTEVGNGEHECFPRPLKPAKDRIDRGLWWDKPWSIVDGCTPVSPACANCWAMAIAKRFGRSTEPRFRPERLEIPQGRRKPTVWAVWNDLFHECVSRDNAWTALATLALECEQHLFLVLTKRIERARELCRHWYLDDARPIPRNVYLGTTVEDQTHADARIPHLLETPAALRFLSVEPMLGPIDLSFDVGTGMGRRDSLLHHGIGFVIIGCESGPRRRPTELAWVRDLIAQCRAAGVPVWIKQLEVGGKVRHRLEEFPEDLRIREWPTD